MLRTFPASWLSARGASGDRNRHRNEADQPEDCDTDQAEPGACVHGPDARTRRLDSLKAILPLRGAVWVSLILDGEPDYPQAETDADEDGKPVQGPVDEQVPRYGQG